MQSTITSNASPSDRRVESERVAAAAVRHALDVAGDKVDGLLDAAGSCGRDHGDARQEAEENTARVKAAAAELVVNTSTRRTA
jgi:hypothetical protein